MSSTTTVMDRRTYWCHECDMSISLLPTPTPTPTPTPSLCPHCNSDFLEALDSPITFTNPNNNNNNNNNSNNNDQLLFPSDGLDNPYFHRVINHLFNSDYIPNPNPNPLPLPLPTSSRFQPAAKSAIESLPSVKITLAFLETDPIVLCAVCKDQFVVNDEIKQLPCKHMYHPDCIIPWLTQRNSCPVCRFQLPIDPVEGELKPRRRSRSRVLRLGDLVEDDDDEELLGFGLRHLARRHRLVFPMRHRVGEGVGEGEVLFSPTQIGEEVRVDVVSDSGRTNSVETVSSWPVDGGEIEIDARVNDDDDVVMS